ncbi:MAG: hypothetical protein KDD06_23925 [Phaeodactylibacter sp.]|nr:hypothetical protein [Phaeodactylibacter sp.]MCB9267041.1 hypothetical protein [Lewinellaceae bacterium]MCB9289326.1 hypothetical protein [Lewinellaceae bacterium]
MKKIYFLLYLLLLLSFSAFGQRLEQFSDDHAEFMRQLEEYMTASKRQALENAYKEFASVFSSGMFNEEETGQILKTGNAMLAQRMMASPYFENYLNALSMIKKASDPERHFRQWHEVLDKILANIENRHLKPFDEFVEASKLFFERQALRYSESGGTSWYALANDYEFRFNDEEGEGEIYFANLDLMANRRTDSIFIYNTSGYFLPNQRLWRGEGGRVTWERHGLGPEVYAELGAYEFEVIKSLYEVREAKMHYPVFFGEGRLIKGSFSDKLVASNDATEGSFPRFESDERVLEINNIGEGVHYIGGFRLNGKTVYGFGTKDRPAEILIEDANSKTAFRGSSELFTIRREELIAGQGVEGVLRFGQDSIYHPSVNVRFDIRNREMALSRGDRASDRNPFFSSLHKVNIHADNIIAYLDQDSVAIGREKIPIHRKPVVEFESFNYFTEKDYQQLQNIATVNPIAVLKVMKDKEGKNDLPANEVAMKINNRFSVENIKGLLYDMVARGFINYNSDDEMVEVKDKVALYADAHRKKTDYDVLKIKSNTDSTNAIMNLRDNRIDIRGVDFVEFSEKQRVAVIPFNKRITMLPNRDIDLDAKVFAGFSTLEGKDFHFKYDEFQFNLDSIRYFDLFIPTGKMNNGQPEAVSIGSRIEHLSGVLLIDAPSNKSGQDDIPLFPSLQSKDNSFVFYDYPKTQKGVYKRDSFYFQLEPFSFNHLDYYTKEDIQFDGTLFSADIFPPFDETVTLQADTSLGFITNTPAEGYPAYQKKGNYDGEVSLSNVGLLAKGNVKYLGASIYSEDIIFMPKQMLASAERFNLEESREEGLEVPRAQGFDVKIDWRPYKDSMYIRSEEAPFALFQEGVHTLDGTLILTPGGLKGDGTFDWDKATMRSHLFSFGAFSSTADTTDVKIKTQDLKDIALETSNVKSDVDFDEEIATFKANDEFLETTLPAIQYKTSMNEFTWEMAKESITFKSDPTKPGRFVSIHPDQDSLFFEGGEAFYDLKTDELKVSGVPFVVAADAFIYPDSNYLEIGRGGVMGTLNNARIIADTLNRYHVINRATVDILGKRLYRATGFYEYNIGDKQQEIEFANIVGQPVGKGAYSQKRVVTRATGEVTPEDNFYIDHKTEFRGRISLEAESKNLSFEGFARLESEKLPHRFWFTVSSKADKNNLVINYDEPKNYDGEPLATGFFLSKETAEVYPRVMMPLFFRKDRPILPVKGVFRYDQEKDQFIFGDSLKVIGGNMRGNQLVFRNRDGKLEGEGAFLMGSGLNYVKVDAAGTMRSEFVEVAPKEQENMIISDTMNFAAPLAPPEQVYQVETDVMTGIKMIVPERLLKIMITDIESMSFDASPVVYLTDLDFYRKATANLLPPGKEADAALASLGTGLLDIPEKVNPYTFLFSRIPMKWNAEYQSFISMKDKNAVASINGEPINRMLESYIEFKMPSNDDDRLYIYIKSPSELFYFFGFKQGILSVTSNNPAFMEELAGMKTKEKVMKMEDGNTYEIQDVDVGTARLFYNRVKAARK